MTHPVNSYEPRASDGVMRTCRFLLVGGLTIRHASRRSLVAASFVLFALSFCFATKVEAAVILFDLDLLYLDSKGTSFFRTTLPGRKVSADDTFALALANTGSHPSLDAPPSDGGISLVAPLFRMGPSVVSEESRIWFNECGEPPAGANPVARSDEVAAENVIAAHIARIDECQRFLQYAMERLMVDLPPSDLDPPIDDAFVQFAPGIREDESPTSYVMEYTVANTDLATSRVRSAGSRTGSGGADGRQSRSNGGEDDPSKNKRIDAKEFIIDFFSSYYTIVFILLLGTTIMFLNLRMR